MKVISKTRVTHTETEVVSLQAAMRRIGSEEFKPVIDEIKRRAGSKEVGHIKVSDLPAIYPCITHTTDMSTGSLLDENNIIPTGLVQFDFDWKDDHYSVVEKESIISEIKGKIKQWPEVVYLFDSPSGGLKFAVMTDLKKGSTEKFKEINSRFKMAYYNLQERYSKELDIEFDGAMAKLKQALFLSYDPDFYYNKNFESIKVNDWTNLEAERKKKEEQRRLPSYSGRYSDNFMVNILSFIPSDLSYDESLKVSYAVSGLLGEQAVNVLSRHWKKDSDKSNRIKLKSVTPSEVYDYLSALIGFARKYVSQNNSSELEALINNHAGINLQTAVPVKQELPPLLTPEQGKLELDQAISEFFSVGSSMCIKASGGLGKTDAVLKAIGQMPEDKKILFLVKTHKNSEEIINRFKLLFGCSKKISLSQGKVRSCNNNEVKEFYESNGIPIPTYECLYNCPLKDGCDYILSRRFDDQIRVMTHDELYSPASIWTYGYTSDPLKAKQLSLPVSGLKPRAMGWKPDFIVVDENHLRLDPVEASYSDQWNSPAEILHKLRKGMDLKQAIASSHNEIMDDQITLTALEERKIKFLNRNDFVSQAKNHNNRIKAAPLIKFLGSIMLDGDGELGRLQARGEKSLLTLYRMKELANRYKNVPTLYLDATAIEAVVKSQVDHLIFREICVKKSPNVVTKMYSNVNFSRQKINEPGGLKRF